MIFCPWLYFGELPACEIGLLFMIMHDKISILPNNSGTVICCFAPTILNRFKLQCVCIYY